MKKTYITPALVAVKIESAQMIATSLGGDTGTISTGEGNVSDEGSVASGKFHGGLLWEDDNAE